MHINRVFIRGFKRLMGFNLELNPTLNIIVGDNETGKSSVLEAINLVLSGHFDGRLIRYAIDPYLFNNGAVEEFFGKQRKGEQSAPPEIEIEAYLQDDPADPGLSKLKGTNNHRNEDCPGLVLKIAVDEYYVEQLKEYAADESNPPVLPVEFYKASWSSFSSNGVVLRNLPFRVRMIDTSVPRVYRGPNKYVAQAVSDALGEDERRNLSLAYRRLCHDFTQLEGVKAINKHLGELETRVSKRNLTVQMDMSSRASWDTSITAHLDALPFDCVGKGEQTRVQMRLAIAAAMGSRFLLIEEPENHLSHSNLNILMEDIQKDCIGRQVIVTTHSAFVLNKLGIDNLRLISQSGTTRAFENLTDETKKYFMKLPGYDTLRLILAERSILVEGPSDELIVQRAYKDVYGKLPLEDGVDVISVGTAVKRFLEVASKLDLHVDAVVDNDGDVAALKKKLNDYINGSHGTIRVFYDDDAAHGTLEPQLLKANSREMLNGILGQKHEDDDSLLKWMSRNKTEYALRMFETDQNWVAPSYIANAIE